MANLRTACRAFVAATIAVSVWANVLHARGNVVSVAFSALPPLAVLGGFEIVSRIPIRADAAWLVRFSRPMATVAISGMAAWLSYWHQNEALLRYTDASTSYLLPLIIDGFMIISSVSLIELNFKIIELDAAELSQKTSSEPTTRPTRKSKRQRIVEYLTKNPTAKPAEVAKKLGLSENYVYVIKRELEASELETMLNH